MPIRHIETNAAEWLDALPDAEGTLLYKHSPFCGVSHHAAREVDAFGERHPEVAIYRVDVVHERALSQELAHTLDVYHASPQAIWIQGGKAEWVASHYQITSEALERVTRRGKDRGAADT